MFFFGSVKILNIWNLNQSSPEPRQLLIDENGLIIIILT